MFEQTRSPVRQVNQYESVAISLASADDIRSWSHGEIKKPETINYRTYRPEKDGLFCERIFGPERDWECFCGKYRGIKHRDIICDRCGVKVTHSRVRREWMGHISLAAPVVHIWFFKAIPSRIGTLLGMKTAGVEKVVYYQDYVVIDPGETGLQERQLLSEMEYRQALEQYGRSFEADMGADAIRKLLSRVDLNKVSQELRQALKETRSKQKMEDYIKRLTMVDIIRQSGVQAENMVLDVVPVIPPDLRPLVFLDSGNFATSDLNDLYRRVINRNNRLKKLIDLNAPDVIVRNEKRMLQQSVDALFDNARSKRSVMGTNNRPLKSLADMIKGKQGRFRENLLGKRVDYSGRSVIVVGPELKLHQCGLPKKIALELFQPFIIRELKQRGLVDTIKTAKKMLDRKDEEVWDVLDDVIHQHTVLLNRAPTLHRMGIQAFEPVLIEGNAIRLHPLVCIGFNADFDGDTMSVHLPLSLEAQVEAMTLMLATHNIFSPKDGNPIMAPSQDMVLGPYFFSLFKRDEHSEKDLPTFADVTEVITAYSNRKLKLQDRIRVRFDGDKKVVGEDGRIFDGGVHTSSAGRILFNDILPESMPFYNQLMTSKALSGIIADCFRYTNRKTTIELLDNIKELGFKSSTVSGVSIALSDMVVPGEKDQDLEESQKKVDAIRKNYERGIITEGERYNQTIDVWTHAKEVLFEKVMNGLKDETRQGEHVFNPIYMMANSGARGGIQQVGQLAGMRGLMASPTGKVIETPIKSNFRDGLTVLEYFSSTHGSRKGLADTALKTADSGYMTRKLADVVQNIVVSGHDCGTLRGIPKRTVYKGTSVEVPLWKSLVGRTSRETIKDPTTDSIIIGENDQYTEAIAKQVESLDYEKVNIRSPLTCETRDGVCQMCYGTDMAVGKLVELGTAVGIISAQSIGEPGTQLTMRTFHIGGTAASEVAETEVKARKAGLVEFVGMRTLTNDKNETVVVNRNGEIILKDKKGIEFERLRIPAGSLVHVEDGGQVKSKGLIYVTDPHSIPLLTEYGGKVVFQDINIADKGELDKPNITCRKEVDKLTGQIRYQIIEQRGTLHPQILIQDSDGKTVGSYVLPEKAYLEVSEGDEVQAGALLAKTAREQRKTQDITAGLPRVSEIFEARRPKDPAVLAEISGTVQIGDRKRTKRVVNVVSPSGTVHEHLVPQGKHLVVQEGDMVRAGDPLVEGSQVPHDILRIKGEEAVQSYLCEEVQAVYRAQNVNINDKHIEMIVASMMRRVQIQSEGDSHLLPRQVVSKFDFQDEVKRLLQEKKKPPTASPLLMGITKSALHSDSFLSAASFQDTTKVLTQAALSGRVDTLKGLKENVIVGHIVPAGTGHQQYQKMVIRKKVTEEELAEARRRHELRNPDVAEQMALPTSGNATPAAPGRNPSLAGMQV